MKNYKEDFVEVPESFTTVDLGIASGFKFGVGFALGTIVVSFLMFLFFGAFVVGFLGELSRSFF